MKSEPHEEKEGLDELLKLYNNLRNGIGGFLDEEEFERVIDHYDEAEELSKALEAVETALTYFPFSSALLLKKADLLLATRKYNQALETLEKAELFRWGRHQPLYLKDRCISRFGQAGKSRGLAGRRHSKL